MDGGVIAAQEQAHRDEMKRQVLAQSCYKKKRKDLSTVTIQETSTVASEEGESGTASCRVCSAEEEQDSPR